MHWQHMGDILTIKRPEVMNIFMVSMNVKACYTMSFLHRPRNVSTTNLSSTELGLLLVKINYNGASE